MNRDLNNRKVRSSKLEVLREWKDVEGYPGPEESRESRENTKAIQSKFDRNWKDTGEVDVP